MAELRRDFRIHETRTGQQVALLHDRDDDDDDDDDDDGGGGGGGGGDDDDYTFKCTTQ